MKIRLLKSVPIEKRWVVAGEVVECDDQRAKALIRAGAAEEEKPGREVSQLTPREADLSPKPRRAARE